MISTLKLTISNSLRYLRREGPLQFLIRLLKEIPYRLSRARSWCRQQLIGRMVELLGNSWKLDGLRFSLDDPSIATKLKSRFVWNTYEAQERVLIQSYLPRDLPVIEGGASIGVVSCVTNSLLENPSNHVVIEGNPKLIDILTKNRNQNGCEFEILNAAVEQHNKEVTFYIHEKFVGGSVQRATEESVTVPATTIGAIVQEKNWEKISLVLDIEGAEIGVIWEEGDVLKKHVAVLIIEMHDMICEQKEIDDALTQLTELGFSLKERQSHVYVYYNEALL